MTDTGASESRPSRPPPANRERLRRRALVIGVPALAGLALLVGGFLAGTRLGGDDGGRYECPGRALAVMDAPEVEDKAVTVLAPMRAPDEPDLVPIDAATTTVLVGERERDGSYRPAGGQLALAVQVPWEAIGRQGAVVSDEDGTFLAQPVITLSPLCRERPTDDRP